MTAEKIELFRAVKTGDIAAEEKLLEENQGLIRSIVKRYVGRGVEPEDLYQLACIGFIKAVRGFDASYGTTFSTYAVPKISGEIRRYLRDDGAIKISRLIRENGVKIRWLSNCMNLELGREPTISELSARSGLSKEDIAICETALQQPESLDEIVYENSGSRHEFVVGNTEEEQIVLRETLRQLVHELPDKLARIIILRYGHECTQAQIGRVLGVSQVQVSRLEKKALDILREKIE